MSLEGEKSCHVQVKSRAEHRGRFPVPEATAHILDAWKRHTDRDRLGSRLVVVLEGGVVGEDLSSDLGSTLADALTDDSDLLANLKANTEHGEMAAPYIDRILSDTVLVGITWGQLDDQTIACLGGLTDLPPSALLLVVNGLRVEVADSSDHNANCGYEDRRSLDRTEIVGEIERIAEQIDLESLETAIREGVCEPLEYSVGEQASGDRFYQGEATQPFHVASGLVVYRPDVMSKVLSALDEQCPVVLTGPSGVGKSAVLWTIPQDRRGVLWFRVKHLVNDDVPSVMRLARAYRVSLQAPVGFLVDSAGTGDFTGWERLRSEADAVPGILLAATARDEDLVVLGDLAGCATVDVRLDESAAEVIHEGLVASGAASVAHWRESFDHSDGLTLEFVHLLTHGRRLQSVIHEQIRRRISEKRHNELEVLALVSVADRWSANVSTADVAQTCELSDYELREALERLNAEHLVVERDGQMGGLHRLRSIAICEAVHELPPPVIGETIQKVIPIVPTAHLHRFIAAMLEEKPDTRGIVADHAGGGELNLERVAA